MSAVEQSGAYPESPNEEGDAIYPCKGCGEVRMSIPAILKLRLTLLSQILEEGKAFELGMFTITTERPKIAVLFYCKLY